MAMTTELSTEVHDDHSHAHPEDGPVVSRNIYERNSLSLSFAFVAGAGLFMMLAAGAIGVIQGSAADSDVLGLLFLAGVVALIGGIVTWAGIVRPWEEFPSVTEGYYDNPEGVQHAHDEHDDPDHQDEHAVVVAHTSDQHASHAH